MKVRLRNPKKKVSINGSKTKPLDLPQPLAYNTLHQLTKPKEIKMAWLFLIVMFLLFPLPTIVIGIIMLIIKSLKGVGA